MSPSSQRSWFSWSWLKGWSWPEFVVVGLLGLLPFSTLAIGGRDLSWLAGVFALVAFAALNVVVSRHGGWRLLGPHFYYDVVRLARRGRSNELRVAYIVALFSGLFYVYANHVAQQTMGPNDFARVSERFAYTLFVIQNLAVVILTPAYLGSAIAEEKERHTLELLFTTQLSDTEIILGKLTSRLIHLFGFVLAGFPILSVIQFWGGIDMLLIAGNLVNTLLNILSIGSICLLASAFCKTVAGAVTSCYALILPVSFCCAGAVNGFPFVLQDARQGGEAVVAVQHLGTLVIAHLAVTVVCLVLACLALREHELLEFGPIPPTRLPDPIGPPKDVAKPTVSPDPVDAFANPYTLPPVTGNALLWKERYLGGPPWELSPVILGATIPLTVTGVLVYCVSLVHALFGDGEEYRHAVEVWSGLLRFFYYVFLACYVLGVAYRSAASVARERQQQTLEPLLLLPIDRSEILFAKWLGSLMRGWPWAALLVNDVVLGVLIGAYHPFSGVLLCLAPWPMIFFFASLGLFLSVTMSTVLRAHLTLMVIMVLFVGCAFTNITGMAYLEPFAFSLWRGPSEERVEAVRAVFYSIMIMAAFLVGALGFWRIALALFDDRGRRGKRPRPDQGRGQK